jgi:hypothetical protein
VYGLTTDCLTQLGTALDRFRGAPASETDVELALARSFDFLRRDLEPVLGRFLTDDPSFGADYDDASALAAGWGARNAGRETGSAREELQQEAQALLDAIAPVCAARVASPAEGAVELHA